MTILTLPLLIYYGMVVAVFCVYGVHRYGQVYRFVRSGGLRAADPEPASRFQTPPRVTVQLPMFNERAVAERIIEAACAIRYPSDRLQIQVLDDSTDHSAEIARGCCARLAAAGHDIEYHHRDRRDGFKAGALAEGLTTASGEFIAIFDADFVPPPTILEDTIDHFNDESIGMVQTRWGHLNADESMLTRIQALSLDGHFVVEQTARCRSGRWFNFNGTAGVWRRQCIDDAGGWEHDTLTEDTDLSYRAQLAGWTFRYLPQVICPAELPATVSALVTQQHRWTKGLLQTAIKLLPTILRSSEPRHRKVEAFFHLTSPLPYAALLLLTILILPGFFIASPSTGARPFVALGLGLGALGLGTAAAAAICVAAQWGQRRPLLPLLMQVPLLMAVGIGVSALNTKAMLEAVLGIRSAFIRTPKWGSGRRGRTDPAATPPRFLPRGAVEVALGMLMLGCAGLTMTHPHTLVGLPFIALFATGYLSVGIGLLRPNRSERRAPLVVPQRRAA